MILQKTVLQGQSTMMQEGRFRLFRQTYIIQNRIISVKIHILILLQVHAMHIIQKGRLNPLPMQKEIPLTMNMMFMEMWLLKKCLTAEYINMNITQ